jgi:hypothetical protein
MEYIASADNLIFDRTSLRMTNYGRTTTPA